MKRLLALAIPVTMLLAQEERAGLYTVSAVRTWSLSEVTRVAVEVSGDFTFRTDRLHNPERVYFDILNTRPRIDAKRAWSKEINDKLVQRVRVAETHPGTTRVVVDLAGAVEISTSQLTSPNRLIVELRQGTTPPIPTEMFPPAVRPPSPIRAEVPKVSIPDPVPSPTLAAKNAEPREAPVTRKVEPSPGASAAVSKGGAPVKSTAKGKPTTEAMPSTETPRVEPVAAVMEPHPTELLEAKSEARVETRPPLVSSGPLPGELGTAARRTSTGGNSLTRALGLKVGRIVIDAGHGGHDQGTQGGHGLLEKELVLDVAQRVGKLVEERMNAEVIYTRNDDTYVPLEGRTGIANQKKADLFLSIHANSSPVPRISGVEVFYLNFSDSKDAMDVAARENASSQKSVFELEDLIHKISLHEKLDESREFAGRVQSALYAFSSRNVPGQKNRGVKKAPFVVLIGANMPSVLAEIGFLSNAREEALLKKADYRQKLAESLYRGIAKYAESLSHFQMAAN
ncbi:MAG: N-acetylmuramoyl-L-alanine amidase [Candidatus Solibacter sp.]